MPCDWAVLYLQDELSLSGYKKHLTSQAAPLPLTAAEEELRQIKLNEVTHTHTHTLRQVIWLLSLGHRLELSSSWRKLFCAVLAAHMRSLVDKFSGLKCSKVGVD